MKKICLPVIVSLFTLLSCNLIAQNNVGIGIATPDNSAVLHLESNNKGVLVPRMTTAQRTAIAAPAEGLMVYDTDVQCFFFVRSGTWISLCSAGGGSNNTTLTYDQNTNVLSLTDGGGTISTTIPPPGRWSVKGTTDITHSGSTFATMAGTTLTFTPTKPVVYIIGSAAGDVGTAQAGGVGVRIKDVGTGAVIVGSNSVTTSLFLDIANFTYRGIGGWNVNMATAYTVTPGVPVTIEMEWKGVWGDNGGYPVRCLVASDPEKTANRSILVYE